MASLYLPQGYEMSFFETTIRYLGGLLSAFTLSGDHMFLQKAEQLAGRLEPAFESGSGLPNAKLFPKSKEDPQDGKYYQTGFGTQYGVLAEIGTLQLEYAYLGKLTGKERYWNRSATVMNAFASANLTETAGMLPMTWNVTSGEPLDFHLSVGSAADSAHEYLLKMFLFGGKKHKTSLEMYLRATTHIISNLIYLSPRRNLLYVTDVGSSSYTRAPFPAHKQEHLSCFFPGLLALGAHTLPLDDLPSLGIDSLTSLGNTSVYGYGGESYELFDDATSTHAKSRHAQYSTDTKSRETTHSGMKSFSLKELHMWAAEGLATTCWLAYADQLSGLAPDEIVVTSTQWSKEEKPTLWMDALKRWKEGVVPGLEDKEPALDVQQRDYYMQSSWYLMRPETVESLFIMWKVTGDVKWRERGWQIFESIEKYTKTAVGYASPRRVDSIPVPLSDDMPSYFLAETLKYLYLLFREDDPWPLDSWVFNAEAHPFPIVPWTEHELERFL